MKVVTYEINTLLVSKSTISTSFGTSKFVFNRKKLEGIPITYGVGASKS